MNGNRAVLLCGNVLCASDSPSLFWRSSAALAWAEEFGESSSFLFDSFFRSARFGAIVELNYINSAAFKRSMYARLQRVFERLQAFDCVCAAGWCTTDYMSTTVLHHLKKLTDRVFYLEKSRIIAEAGLRKAGDASPALLSKFREAVLRGGESNILDALNVIVRRLCTDMPPPKETRMLFSQMLGCFLSLTSCEGIPRLPLLPDSSSVFTLRDALAETVQSVCAQGEARQALSPVAALAARVEANPGNPLSIDEAARITNFSRSHFCRLFRQETGMSFTAFQRRKRIAKACELLKKTGMSMNEVAAFVGFENTWYFKKVFAQEMGFPPETFLCRDKADARTPAR